MASADTSEAYKLDLGLTTTQLTHEQLRLAQLLGHSVERVAVEHGAELELVVDRAQEEGLTLPRLWRQARATHPQMILAMRAWYDGASLSAAAAAQGLSLSGLRASVIRAGWSAQAMRRRARAAVKQGNSARTRGQREQRRKVATRLLAKGGGEVELAQLARALKLKPETARRLANREGWPLVGRRLGLYKDALELVEATQALPPEQRPKVPQLSEQLGLSASVVRQALVALGCSWRADLQDAKAARARELLASDPLISPYRLATQLGLDYGDMKRWAEVWGLKLATPAERAQAKLVEVRAYLLAHPSASMREVRKACGVSLDRLRDWALDGQLVPTWRPARAHR